MVHSATSPGFENATAVVVHLYVYAPVPPPTVLVKVRDSPVFLGEIEAIDAVRAGGATSVTFVVMAHSFTSRTLMA